MSNKNKTMGEELLIAVDEALNHTTKGRIARPLVDIVDLRKKLLMSQTEFAKTYHINLKTLRQWEQNARTPDSTAIAYLQCIAKAPEQINNILNM